jgi:hypothetical protein
MICTLKRLHILAAAIMWAALASLSSRWGVLLLRMLLG